MKLSLDGISRCCVAPNEHLVSDVFLGCNRRPTLHPRVEEDVCYYKSLVWINIQHRVHQGYEFAIDMLRWSILPHITPVLVRVSLHSLVVVVSTWVGSRKRIKPCHEVEKNGTKGKQVHSWPIILHLLPYFRRHVPRISLTGQVVAGAESLRFCRASLSCAREAETHDLHIVGRILYQNVIGSKLTMRKALLMDEVKTFEHLFEVVLADGLGKGTLVNECQELLTLH